MPSVDVSRPVNKWTVLKTVFLLWLTKSAFWLLNSYIRFNGWLQTTYLGKKMQELFDSLKDQDWWDELFLPVCLVLLLAVALWVANDCSFQLPHYE